MGLLADPDDADHRIQQVIHHHAPSGDVAERRIDLLSDVGEGGTRAGISPRHAPVTDRGEQHCHHRDQDRRDHVSVAAIAEHAEYRHRRDRLNHDDAVKDEVPKSQSPPKTRGRRSASGSGCHVRVLDYVAAKLSTIKTIPWHDCVRPRGSIALMVLRLADRGRISSLSFNRRRTGLPPSGSVSSWYPSWMCASRSCSVSVSFGRRLAAFFYAISYVHSQEV